ncbi:heme o synthase [Salinarchaeum chitinilyticum]
MTAEPDAEDAHSFTTLLAVTAIGAYLLVILGATNAVAEAASTCTTWPVCEGALGALEKPQLAIAIGHRVAALVVGVLVLAATVFAFRRSTRRRVRIALAVALALYPVQIGLGALAATSGGATGWLGTLHLGLGLTIFASVLVALAWSLDARTASAEDREPMEAPEPVTATDESLARDVPDGGVARAKLVALAYFRMTKPRLMWLLCLVAAAGMALAAGPAVSPRSFGLTMLGGVLAIGASGTFNNVLERDVDRRMNRTADRPLAVDLVPVENAILFGLALAAASLAAFLAINRLAAVLGLVAIAYYSVIYTVVLKPNTVQNTVIGGGAGALPALIGWAAVTNEIGIPALALAGVIFLWTPAHFYNLALAYKEDYARGGFPMLPVVRGEATARRHVLWYLGATLAAAAVLGTVSSLGPVFAVTSVVAGGAFLWAAIRLHHEQTEAAALRSFHASNAYLGLVLLAIIVDAVVLNAGALDAIAL